MCRGGTLQSAECHPGTSDSLRNFTAMVHKVSPKDFLPVLGAPRPKITLRSFWSACDQTRSWDRSWSATRLVKFPNFYAGESISHRNFTPVNPKVSLQDFLLILAALPTKIMIRSFWPWCDQMGQVTFPKFSPRGSTSLRNLTQWSRTFPSRIFYSFWPPYRQKFRFGLLDQDATKWVKFPNFSQFSAVGA